MLSTFVYQKISLNKNPTKPQHVSQTCTRLIKRQKLSLIGEFMMSNSVAWTKTCSIRKLLLWQMSDTLFNGLYSSWPKCNWFRNWQIKDGLPRVHKCKRTNIYQIQENILCLSWCNAKFKKKLTEDEDHNVDAVNNSTESISNTITSNCNNFNLIQYNQFIPVKDDSQ